MLAVASLLLFGKLSLHSLYMTRPITNMNLRGINEGRQAAREIDLYLEQYTSLPVTGGIIKRTAQEIFTQIKVEA